LPLLPLPRIPLDDGAGRIFAGQAESARFGDEDRRPGTESFLLRLPGMGAVPGVAAASAWRWALAEAADAATARAAARGSFNWLMFDFDCCGGGVRTEEAMRLDCDEEEFGQAVRVFTVVSFTLPLPLLVEPFCLPDDARMLECGRFCFIPFLRPKLVLMLLPDATSDA